MCCAKFILCSIELSIMNWNPYLEPHLLIYLNHMTEFDSQQKCKHGYESSSVLICSPIANFICFSNAENNRTFSHSHTLQTEGHTYGGSGRKMFNRVCNTAGGGESMGLYRARAGRG